MIEQFFCFEKFLNAITASKINKHCPASKVILAATSQDLPLVSVASHFNVAASSAASLPSQS